MSILCKNISLEKGDRRQERRMRRSSLGGKDAPEMFESSQGCQDLLALPFVYATACSPNDVHFDWSLFSAREII